jgi:hypothetical protein
VDFQLMREMRWTWAELQGTPIEVRTFTWDFIRMQRAAEAERAEKAKKQDPGGGAARIEY